MLKTVRCYEIDEDSKLLWEEMVTYDTDYWDYGVDAHWKYTKKNTIGFIYYLGKSNKVPKKPDGMMHCCYTFRYYKGIHLDLSNFDTSNVTDMNCMFGSCTSLQSLDLSSFDTSNVTNMEGMFGSCTSLQSLDLSSFDTSNVTDMHDMFSGCNSLQSLDLSNFDTSNVADMSGMFSFCGSLQSLVLSSFDTTNVIDMVSMFFECESLRLLDLSSFDTFNVTSMCNMFRYCSSLQSLDLSSFDTSNVTNMREMFYNCKSLQSLDLSSFDTSNVTTMRFMFCNCTSLQSLDLSSFDTSKVTNMEGMFWDCWNLLSLDLSSFDTYKVKGTTSTMNMFSGTILTKKNTGFGTFSKKPKTPNVRNKGSICNKDSIDAIFNEIDNLFHNGNVISPTSLVKGLESKGYSESEIVGAIYNKIESGDLDRGMYIPVINSYVSKVVIPTITKYFSGRNVGEVLDILYSKYPRVIVNEAMCMYLRPQYLVD